MINRKVAPLVTALALAGCGAGSGLNENSRPIPLFNPNTVPPPDTPGAYVELHDVPVGTQTSDELSRYLMSDDAHGDPERNSWTCFHAVGVHRALWIGDGIAEQSLYPVSAESIRPVLVTVQDRDSFQFDTYSTGGDMIYSAVIDNMTYRQQYYEGKTRRRYQRFFHGYDYAVDQGFHCWTACPDGTPGCEYRGPFL